MSRRLHNGRTLLVATALLGSVLVPLSGASPALAGTATATANFSVGADYPLIKSKFGVMNSGYVSPTRWAADTPLLAALRPARVRWETMWGNEQPGWSPAVTGTASSLSYNFSQVDSVVDVINAAHAQPVPILAYTPTPLQPAGGSWNSVPTPLSTWTNTVVPAFVNHWRNTGRPIGSYEIWNEPDLSGVFWTGSQSDYDNLYSGASQAIRAANPDAYVEGPASCCGGWNSSFINYVTSNNLPLDGFSFHYYGSATDGGIESGYQGATDSGLTSYRMASVENNINEYNWTHNFVAPTDVTNYRSAAELLASFKGMLAKPWVTHVEWAQFQDPVCPSTCDIIGLLDQNGHRRASYNAFNLYANMPVDRKQLTISGSVDGMASSDPHKAGMLLWNTSGSSQTVTANLQNIPFSTGNFRIYPIDANHASYGDNPANEMLTPTTQLLGVPMSSVSTQTVTIPDHGVVYLEAEDGTGVTNLDHVNLGTDIRDLSYDPNHGKTSYSSFDRNTWTAQLGMGTEDYADAETGVVAENLPNNLQVQFNVQGTPAQLDNNSLLGMRVDYATSSGYTKGVLFHGSTYNAARSAPIPWGTQRQPDAASSVSLSSFNVDLNANAPAGWNGRVTISFIAQNLGHGVRSSVSIRQVDPPAFKIVNLKSSKVLDVSGGSQANSAAAIQSTDTTPAALNHQWELVDAGGGYSKIVNLNSGLLLAVASASTSPGALVTQYDDNGTADHLWKLLPSGTGKYRIQNKNSGLVLGIVGGSTADGAGADQDTDNGNSDHYWQLLPLTSPVLSNSDFESGSATGWTAQSGTWAVCHPSSYEYCSSATADSVSLVGSSGWRAYTVTSSVLANSSPSNAGIALVARAQDGTHYYEGEMKKGSDGVPVWTISKNNGGSWTLLGTGSYLWPSGAGNYMQLRFAAQGSQLTLQIQGSNGLWQTLGSASDTTFTTGKAGVRTWGLTGSFDNVRVNAG